jgi:hypothetical protein
MHDAGLGAPGSAALGDMTPTCRSLGTAGPGVFRLLLSGFSGFPPTHIDWRRVDEGAEFACSQVTMTEVLLHETLPSVGQNILRSIRVSLKKVEWLHVRL